MLTLAAQSARRSSALTADLARANRERQSEHSTAAQRLHALASELQTEQHACANLQQVRCYSRCFRSILVDQCAPLPMRHSAVHSLTVATPAFRDSVCGAWGTQALTLECAHTACARHMQALIRLVVCTAMLCRRFRLLSLASTSSSLW